METLKAIAVHTFSAVLAFIIVFVLFSFWMKYKGEKPATGGCGCGGACGGGTGKEKPTMPPIVKNPLPPLDEVQIINGVQQLETDYFSNTTWATRR